MTLATLPPPPFDAWEVGPLRLTMYGLLVATGVVVALTWTVRRYGRLGGEGGEPVAERVALWSVVLGFVGARAAYVLPRLDRFADDPLGVLRVWEGGLALFGGLTLGLITLVVTTRRLGGDVPTLLDAVAPALPVAQAIGRWGNYFNQELYGRPTDLPWALEVEPGRRVDEFAAADTFHPTFLYESLYNLALAGFLLWLGRRRLLPRGALALVYLIGYTIARFGLELLRVDTDYRLLGLSRNAWYALAVLVCSAVVLAVWVRRGRRAGDPDAAGPGDDASGDDAPGDDAPGDDPGGGPGGDRDRQMA